MLATLSGSFIVIFCSRYLHGPLLFLKKQPRVLSCFGSGEVFIVVKRCQLTESVLVFWAIMKSVPEQKAESCYPYHTFTRKRLPLGEIWGHAVNFLEHSKKSNLYMKGTKDQVLAIISISSKLQCQWCHVGSLKLGTVRVLPIWTSANTAHRGMVYCSVDCLCRKL